MSHYQTAQHVLDALSKREQQVAAKVSEGLPNKLIANQLFISERTVKFHCNNIYRKLGIRNRSTLIANYYKSMYGSGGQQSTSGASKLH